MCHITKAPHPCGHTSIHVLMACHEPKYSHPASHDPYCAYPKVQLLSKEMAVGYECAICTGAQEKYDRKPDWDFNDRAIDQRLKEVSERLETLTRDGDHAEAANSGGQTPFQGLDGWVMVEKESPITTERPDARAMAGSSRENHTKRDSKKENLHPAANRYGSGTESRNGKRQSF